MRAATRESVRERMIRIMALALVISVGFLAPKAAAQSKLQSSPTERPHPCIKSGLTANAPRRFHGPSETGNRHYSNFHTSAQT
jgi:hypothetical protein